MKKLLPILLLAFLGSNISAQDDAIEKYFLKYLDNEEFTVVYVSPKMFDIVAKMDLDNVDPEVTDVISGLKGLRILTTETNTLTYYEEALEKIDPKEYEVLMKVRDGDENVHFLIKEGENDKISELLLLVGGDSDFVLLSFVGDIDLDKISRLANAIDVKGAEHLDKIEK